MLISFSFENVTSFKENQTLSLEALSFNRDDVESLNNNLLTTFQGDKLLKSTLIYGANASGKTNLIQAMEWFKIIVLSSYRNLEQNLLKIIMPFILDKDCKNKPSEFEISFIEKNIKYRYGLSIFNGEIIEEWLYFNANKRETSLFFREKQSVEFNQSNFDEIKLFVKTNKDNKYILERVANHIPLVSILSVFEGEHSQNIISFFNKIRPISGLNDQDLGVFTFGLIKSNSEFYQWIKPILLDFNIQELIVEEVEITHNFSPKEKNIHERFEFNIQQKGISVSVQKYLNHSEELTEFPLELESAGTRKIIHLLGPIYDSIKNGYILLIDEFDSKFHTLLSKHILKLFHQNCQNSQLIANVQDTLLMDTEIFRRDQIWFVHKQVGTQDSILYSLAEYKVAIQKLYSQDYLNGAFDAIPLFSSLQEINALMENDNG